MVAKTLRPLDSMRIALAVALTIAPISAAAAQTVVVDSSGVVSDSVRYGGYPGDGLTLIDPGTGQTRVVGGLLQPWQFHEAPVKLHPPRKHVRAATDTALPSTAYAAEPAAPVEKPRAVRPKHHAAATPSYSEPAPAPVETPKPRKVATAKPVPQAPRAPVSDPLSGFGDLQTLTMSPANKPAAPAPKKPAPAPVAAPAPAAPKPVKQASIAPSRLSLPHTTPGTRKDSITFSPNASDPSASAVGSVRTLANGLADQLNDGAARVQLMAYAGQRGEKTSDTRRLSLKRALVVRQLLIDDGIPSERIDVFALGGADDAGPLDRVDVLIKR